MLSESENDRFTRVGPATPMGELFRRYWQPVAATAELQHDPVSQVRILGETLVLYRDRQGRLGPIGERCSHRGTAMVYGIPEPEGLRCPAAPARGAPDGGDSRPHEKRVHPLGGRGKARAASAAGWHGLTASIPWRHKFVSWRARRGRLVELSGGQPPGLSRSAGSPAGRGNRAV